MTWHLTIRTNNKWRNPLYWENLTATEQGWFDYLDDEDKQHGAMFIRYRGIVYDLGDMCSTCGMPEQSPMRKWSAYLGDSYFSGIVVRWNTYGDAVQVGTYCG